MLCIRDLKLLNAKNFSDTQRKRVTCVLQPEKLDRGTQ